MFTGISLGLAALLYSVLLTPLVRNLFLRLGVVDKPDNIRKIHTRQIPRVGGISVFLSYLLAFVTVFAVPFVSGNLLTVLPGNTWLLFAVGVVFATGLIDDLVGLLPRQKMAGQVLAAVLAWLGGIQIHLFHGLTLDAWMSLPVTVIWLLICANAFNLIDGLDGLAAGIGLFATLTMLAAALLDHNLPLVLVTLPLLGCLLGFLPYNFNPASLFLGDCGSLTIGFMLGCFGILWSQKINTFLGLSAPLMAVSLPLIDTSLSIARRFLRNRPIFSGDRGHIHHRLLERGNSPRRTVILLYLACGAGALLALAQQCLHRQFGALVILIFCGAVWAGVSYLGYVEFGFARRFFATGTLFRLIDDQIKLVALEKSLAVARTEREALDMIGRTCAELGFSDVIVKPRIDRKSPFFSDHLKCQVAIPFGAQHIVVLSGLAGIGRPIALPQLTALLAHPFKGAWERRIMDEEREISDFKPFSEISEVSSAEATEAITGSTFYLSPDA